jgi:GTP-dependent phosphoenolpyruvate carboxykinase
MEELLRVDTAEWKTETESQKTFFEGFGPRLPQAIREELEALRKRLG